MFLVPVAVTPGNRVAGFLPRYYTIYYLYSIDMYEAHAGDIKASNVEGRSKR